MIAYAWGLAVYHSIAPRLSFLPGILLVGAESGSGGRWLGSLRAAAFGFVRLNRRALILLRQCCLQA